MSTTIDTLSSQTLKASSIAQSLNSDERQKIAIQAIGGNTPISHVAEQYGVSRKFVYQQKEKALNGITEAFDEQPENDDKVLFYIPVTKKWLVQVVLALLLICRASYQGVVEFFRDVLNYDMS